jgi:hypothetical protein
MNSIKTNGYQFEFEPLIHTENEKALQQEEYNNAVEFYNAATKPKCKLRTVTFKLCFHGKQAMKKIEDAFQINQTIFYIIVEDIQLKDNNESSLGFLNMMKKILSSKNQIIQHLNLQSCLIGNKGASIIASALDNPNCKLKYLHLNDNKIKNDGATAFAKVLRNPHCNLEFLNLNHNEIKITGLHHLSSALKKNIKIQDLDIDHQLNLNWMAQSSFKSEISVPLKTNRKIEQWFTEFDKTYSPEKYTTLQKKGILSTQQQLLFKKKKIPRRVLTDKKYDPTLPTQIRLLINQYLITDVRNNIPQFYRWVEKHKNFSQSLGVLGALKRFENNKTSSL